jgi:hypothetical protein
MFRHWVAAARGALAAVICLGLSSAGWAQVGTNGVAPIPRFPNVPARPATNRRQPVEELQEPPLRPGTRAPMMEGDQGPVSEGGAAIVPEAQLTASPFLQWGQINVGYSWSYADTDHIYLGKERLFMDEQVAQVRAINNTHTVAFEMGMCERWSLVYELPFQYNSRRQQAGPISGNRIDGYFVTDTGDVADSRLFLRKWLYDAGEYVHLFNRPGNVAVAAGVKLPTGREDKSTFFEDQFYFHDVSVQTGTGSTDIYLAAAGYLEMGYLVPYAGFNWTLTPDEESGVLAFHPQIADPATTLTNSIFDSFSWTVGFRYDIGKALLTGQLNDCCNQCPIEPRMICDPCTGCARESLWSLERLKFTFSLDGSHVPSEDVFGDNPGFRRPFDALFVTTGFTYDLGSNCSVFANVPITVYRNLHGVPGTFPHTQLNVGAAFNIR